jgi:ferritin-like metal-binding protein YciE
LQPQRTDLSVFLRYSTEIELLQRLLANQQERLNDLKQYQTAYDIRGLPDDIEQEIKELETEVESLQAELSRKNAAPSAVVDDKRSKFISRIGTNVGNMVAGDRISVGTISGTDVAIGRSGNVSVSPVQLFAPLVQVMETNGGNLDQVQLLRAEVSRGENASDEKIASLIMDITDAVPEAASVIARIFANPMVARVSGGATKYVLRRLRR